ncbi:hypothetical protein [sulfur-oxidizing endosymbiont of Gigantopelta aegis]|uniref:WYL domain-containing protein n=1 Tax=sulfur-oxidizing endosymbiont of Gigantopelta aegis TaxID=2794934 RepID=UPI001FE5C58B|nr:hypothetical protein [sulfur-oxidizing endosymbiont of Gigantopelta aegis]
MGNQETYSLSLLLKYQLIEIMALWEGRLTATHLVNAFAIDVNRARKLLNVIELKYQMRIWFMTNTSKVLSPLTILSPGSFDEYMQLLNSNNDLSAHLSYLKMEAANTEVIFSPARHIVPENIRPIIAAIYQIDRLDIQYSSFTSGTDEGRVITPHSLVYSGYRWHVRAHCEKTMIIVILFCLVLVRCPK